MLPYIPFPDPFSHRYDDIASLQVTISDLLFMKTRMSMDQKWCLSYATRRTGKEIWTYDSLNNEVLNSKRNTINFLMEKGVLKECQFCPKCSGKMVIANCSESDAIEQVQFRCQRLHFESGGKFGGVLKLGFNCG